MRAPLVHGGEIMFSSKLVAILATSVMLALPANADDGWASRDYDFAKGQLNDFVSRFQRDLVDPVSRGIRAGRSAPAAAARSTAVPVRTAVVPRSMAAAYPEPDRARMEATFRKLLAGYEQIEQRFQIPRRDVAGAVAAFIAGCYMAYRNVDFPDSHFPPLVSQIRSIIASDPSYARASVQARQDMYEQLAILGMFMANAQMALRQRSDPEIAARVRTAAAEYLQQFLKTDAGRVRITARGLVLD
jgi:hypothetical protein